MGRATIVVGGNDGFQLPAPLIFLEPTTMLGSAACKVFAWMLWHAHRTHLWRRAETEEDGIAVRFHGRDMLNGAGFASRKGYGELRAALSALAGARFRGTDACLVSSYDERPGPHFDVTFPPELIIAHARPLARYALVNMAHIRALKQPLDMAIYARACLVARARHARFEIGLDEMAAIAGATGYISWSVLRRQVLASFVRVCAATGGRIVIQGRCSGDRPGVDRLLCHVGLATDVERPRFHPRPQAIVIDVTPAGASRFQ